MRHFIDSKIATGFSMINKHYTYPWNDSSGNSIAAAFHIIDKKAVTIKCTGKNEITLSQTNCVI